ncbi:MAG: hypothetical protein NTX45_00065 [Proteobacteria bacterium]|nr:hypothetical protein [Pseudomonadota bacterium]
MVCVRPHRSADSGCRARQSLRGQQRQAHQYAAADRTAAANVLFLRYNALPTGSDYDAAYQGALQANQYAVIPSAKTGTYYVLVHGQSEPAANTPVTLLAHVLPFGITDASPDTGGGSRYVTTTILGAQFAPQARLSKWPHLFKLNISRFSAFI